MAASIRSLPWLRDKLRQGLPLPKDRWVENHFDGRYLHEYHVPYRDAERRMLLALTEVSAPLLGKKAAMRVALCLPSRRCGSWVCYYCRHVYWRVVRRKAKSIAKSLTRDEITFVTIIAGAADLGIPHVGGIIDDAHRELLGVVKWQPDISVLGRFEVDYWLQGLAPGKNKRHTLRHLKAPIYGEVPFFVPHLHALIFHPDVDREFLKCRLKQSFPGSRRVKVEPLKEDKTVRANIDRVVRYPLKYPTPLENSNWMNPEELRFYHRMIEAQGGLLGKGACIVIENKVDADDQPKQLLRYWRWLESKREGFPHRALIYLTPDGTPPSRQSMGVGRRGFQPALTESLVRLSYRRDIAGWLSGAGRGAPAAVQVFVNQYVELVRSI